jgi:hypothetical protein
MSKMVHWNPVAKQYSNISGITFGFAIVAPIISWFALQTNIEAIQAIGVLIVPFALFCWIFTTIRALHQRAVRFWFIPSTYVAFFGGVTATIFLFVGLLLVPHTPSQGGFASYNSNIVQHPTNGNYVMMFAAAIVQAGTTMWCLWYNWKKTGALVLALSLTALQTLFSSLLVAFVWFRFGGSGDHDHIDASTGQVNVRERMPV